MKPATTATAVLALTAVGFLTYQHHPAVPTQGQALRDALNGNSDLNGNVGSVLEKARERINSDGRQPLKPVSAARPSIEIDPDKIDIDNFTETGKIGRGMAYIDGKAVWRTKRPCTLIKTDYETESTDKDILVLAFNSPRDKDSRVGYKVKGVKGTFWEKEPLFFLDRTLVTSQDIDGSLTYTHSQPPQGVKAELIVYNDPISHEDSVMIFEKVQAQNGTSTLTNTFCGYTK